MLCTIDDDKKIDAQMEMMHILKEPKYFRRN